MGKASRRKKERRVDRGAVLLGRLKAGRCLHCGGPRDISSPAAVWCRACAREGRRRARLAPPLGVPWRKDPRIKWPTVAEMNAAIDELERAL